MKREACVVHSDCATGTVLEFQSQCHRCARGEGCGAAVLGLSQNKVQLRVESGDFSHPMDTGQRVVVEFDDNGSDWLWPVFGAYGLPLLGMLLATGFVTVITQAGADTTSVSRSAEILVIIGAVSGLFGGVFAWRQLAARAFARTEHGLCQQSARIVAIHPFSERESG